MNQRRYQGGYIGLLMLLIGTGLALYLYMEYSPLGHGATDQGVMQALDAKKTAESVQGMADKHNAELEDASQ